MGGRADQSTGYHANDVTSVDGSNWESQTSGSAHYSQQGPNCVTTRCKELQQGSDKTGGHRNTGHSSHRSYKRDIMGKVACYSHNAPQFSQRRQRGETFGQHI